MPHPSNPTDVLLHERDARGVVTLTLHRPQAFNALSEALLDALQEQINALMDDDEARVVLSQRGESGIELHRVLLSHGFAAGSRWMTLAGMTSWLARS